MPTMSTHIPLRLSRIPAQPLRRQCLFQPSRPAAAPRPFAASTVRPFSASATRPRQQKPSGYRLEDLAMQHAAAQQMVNPAPSVFIGQMSKKRNALADDIGLMQGTVIRAPLSQLPPVHTLNFWRYFWTLFRSKLTALYTRSVFRQCAQKKGAARFLPIDIGNKKILAKRAKSLYEAIHLDLAQRNTGRLRKHCLEPLAEQITNRMAAGKAVKTSWSVKKWKSARVLSHRASPMGAERPDTAYRQVVVRLESVQHMKVTPIPAERPLPKGSRPAWTPDGAPEESLTKPGEGRIEETKTVVDYFVIQQRVISGQLENWKAWGFTTASTPATIESDDEYWRKTVEAQTAGLA